MVKNILKFSGLTLLSMVGFVALYLLSAYLLSRIGISAEKTDETHVAIYIITNGVHTDIVVPIRSPWIDWSRQVKFAHTQATDTAFQFLGMGWGDKGFYLETPTWADLKASVAFKAATGLSTTAIHATYYYNLKEDETCRKILISKEQYVRLIDYIIHSFQKNPDGEVINIKTNANYGKTDAFYEANGSYSLFHTCNTWANNALKACGQKACLWTPFDWGIFYHYR